MELKWDDSCGHLTLIRLGFSHATYLRPAMIKFKIVEREIVPKRKEWCLWCSADNGDSWWGLKTWDNKPDHYEIESYIEVIQKSFKMVRVHSDLALDVFRNVSKQWSKE